MTKDAKEKTERLIESIYNVMVTDNDKTCRQQLFAIREVLNYMGKDFEIENGRARIVKYDGKIRLF